jgi:tetratricopeptide (TPR) repeat protein
MENDSEILMFRLIYFLKMNNSKESAAIIDLLNAKDSDSVSTTIGNVMVNLYNGTDLDKTLNMLAEIKQNYKMTPKLFNTIAVAMMFNGKFKEAVKPLNIGLEACTKSGTSNYDLNVILVNLISCYRNLGLSSELKDTEDKLRNYDPNNKYFARLKQFEEEFEK